MTQPPPSRSLRALLRGSAGLAVAVGVMNVATYAFQMLAARLLGPAEYGAVAGLMAMLLVVGVLQLAMQATAARRVSASPEAVAEIERQVLGVARPSGLVLTAALLVLSPLVWHLLRLESIYPALLLAASAYPLAVVGAQSGILQGERRWAELSVLYATFGMARLLIGLVAMLIRPTEGSAMAAVAVALLVPTGLGALFLRRRGHRGDQAPDGDHPRRAVLSETLHGAFALLAFLAITNADIVIARNVLTDHDSGLYAGGLILTKAVLFLPQFVVVIAFPALSTARERRRTLLRGMTLVSLLGAGCVAGAALLSGVAMIFVGGSDYAEIEHRLWLFALLGTELALLQLLVYSVLARQSRRSSYLTLAALAVLVLCAPLVDTIDELLVAVAVIDGVLLLTLLALSLWRMRHDATEPAAARSTA